MDQQIMDKIRTAFHEAFSTPPEQVQIETTPEDIEGWDSLGHVTLGNELEDAFEMSFTVDELMQMEDVKSIVKIIDEKSKAS